MHHRLKLLVGVVALFALSVCGTPSVARADSQPNEQKSKTLDGAFEKLKTYDFGTDRDELMPIDDAINTTHDKPEARRALETRLAAVLSSNDSDDAKAFALRKLRIIGTAESVPAIAPLLEDKNLSHMARYALELNPAPEAGQAIRDALPIVKGKLKIGMIGSLASRHDKESVAAIAESLTDPDKQVACTAAHALGAIGDSEAAHQLEKFLPDAPKGVKPAATDAYLVCAESLLKNGKKGEAIAIYKSLMHSDAPKSIRLAATHGLLMASGAKD